MLLAPVLASQHPAQAKTQPELRRVFVKQSISSRMSLCSTLADPTANHLDARVQPALAFVQQPQAEQRRQRLRNRQVCRRRYQAHLQIKLLHIKIFMDLTVCRVCGCEEWFSPRGWPACIPCRMRDLDCSAARSDYSLPPCISMIGRQSLGNTLQREVSPAPRRRARPRRWRSCSQ